MLTPAHAGVGNEQDLQFVPPHPGPICRSDGQSVNGVDPGDLFFGDGPVDGLVIEVGFAMPANATQQILAGKKMPLLEASVDEPGQAALEVLGDRRRASLVEDLLEVVTGKLAARDVADDREYVQVAEPGCSSRWRSDQARTRGGRRAGSR